MTAADLYSAVVQQCGSTEAATIYPLNTKVASFLTIDNLEEIMTLPWLYVKKWTVDSSAPIFFIDLVVLW